MLLIKIIKLNTFLYTNNELISSKNKKNKKLVQVKSCAS
jgi:hypothetical protein